MLSYFRKFFSNTVYIQIWADRIKATDLKTGSAYDEKALISLIENKSGQKIVEAIGNSVEKLSDDNRKIIKPFNHPRVLIADFMAGEKILQHIFQTLKGKSLLSPSPIAIVHPMEKLEGGLTLVEEKALRELAFGAGAHEVHLKIGRVLSAYEATSWIKEQREKRDKTDDSKITVFVILLGIISLYILTTNKLD